MKKKPSRTFRVIRWLVKSCYPKITLEGMQNLPQEPVVLVGNHAQIHGPIISELYAPGPHDTWCIGQMMELKTVPAYAYQDFWSQKPKALRWFYKLLSYIIAPLAVCIFNNANTIGVYHDVRTLTTFKETVRQLQAGRNIVIFPESDQPYDHIVYQFQDRFVDVARLYYKKTGKQLCFVPIYVAPKLRKLVIGAPVRFCADNPMDEERQRVCRALMEAVSQLAQAQPEHIVIPYQNLPKRCYAKNTDKEPVA